MNKITLLFLISILPVISFAREEPRIEKPLVLLDQESRTEPYHENFIRICTWNIEWFPAGQRNGAEQATQWQLAAVANLISKIKPDILLTQETRNLASLKRLNENLNRPRYRSIASSWFYEENEGKTSMGDKIQQQCGILSRYPWENIREIDFAPLPNPRPTRGWLMAQFQINEEQVTIYNGHLKSNYGAKEESTRLQNYAKRESAIDWLEQDLKDQDLDPYRDKIIVAGDFNTDFYQSSFSDEKTFNKLSKLGFKNTYVLVENEKRITIPSREGEPWPDGTFDYIWISSGWRLPDLKATVLMEGASKRKDVFGGDEPGLASDHYPVYIDIPVTKN